ncbi:MFS transporter [Escherichia coli]|nr:MFS transporter [Escherichia coli]
MSKPTNQSGATAACSQSFRAIAGNRPLFILRAIANLCTLGAFNVKLAIQVYYTQYVLQRSIPVVIMGLFQHGLYFHRRVPDARAVRRFGKKKVYIGGLLIWVLGDLLNYFFGGGSVSFVAFSCLAFFGSAFVNSLNWALVSDTVEYGEWRTGVRSEGTVCTGLPSFAKCLRRWLVSSPAGC